MPYNKENRRIHQKEVRQRNKAWIDEYKVKLSCKYCGFNTHASALDFDHRDPRDKSFEISSIQRHWRSRKAIEQEISKCDVVCANCHRMKHAGVLV